MALSETLDEVTPDRSLSAMRRTHRVSVVSKMQLLGITKKLVFQCKGQCLHDLVATACG